MLGWGGLLFAGRWLVGLRMGEGVAGSITSGGGLGGCEVGLLLIWTVEKRVFFAWTEECRNAIQLLQECITTALVLA